MIQRSPDHTCSLYAAIFLLAGFLLNAVCFAEIARNGTRHIELAFPVTMSLLGFTLIAGAVSLFKSRKKAETAQRVQINASGAFEIVTGLLAIFTLMIFAHINRGTIIEHFALQKGGLDWRESYRLLSYALIHHSFLHLVNNVMGVALWWVLISPVMGQSGKWTCFVFGIVVGGLLSSITLGIVSIGASAGVGSLIGVGLASCLKRRGTLQWRLIVITVAYFNYLPLLSSAFVDHVSHLAGLLTGFVFVLGGAARFCEMKSSAPVLTITAQVLRFIWWIEFLFVAWRAAF